MRNTKRKQHVRRRTTVNDGGGRGLISAYDDLMSERQARMKIMTSIISIIKPSLGPLNCVSDDLAIANILSDLKHYCDCNGLAFGKLQKVASAIYLEEKSYEAF
jgi:hypothetical protein